MKNQVWYLIELPGQVYMATRKLACYEFYWTEDPSKALRFFSHEQADTTAMAIRELHKDLFPEFLSPRVVECV